MFAFLLNWIKSHGASGSPISSPPCVSDEESFRVGRLEGKETQNIVLHTFCKHIWLIAEIAVTALFLRDQGASREKRKEEERE